MFLIFNNVYRFYALTFGARKTLIAVQLSCFFSLAYTEHVV